METIVQKLGVFLDNCPNNIPNLFTRIESIYMKFKIIKISVTIIKRLYAKRKKKEENSKLISSFQKGKIVSCNKFHFIDQDIENIFFYTTLH